MADDFDELVMSLASAWEMAIKLSIGKLRLHEPLREILVDARTTRGIASLAIREPHILRLREMPLHHRDPFDRILAAQALEEGLVGRRARSTPARAGAVGRLLRRLRDDDTPRDPARGHESGAVGVRKSKRRERPVSKALPAPQDEGDRKLLADVAQVGWHVVKVPGDDDTPGRDGSMPWSPAASEWQRANQPRLFESGVEQAGVAALLRSLEVE